MIQYLYADELDAQPGLGPQMYRDRAAQFRDRLGWSVDVDAVGEERDAYDAEIPLYVIATDAAGRHAGSMRFLPTTGPTMVNDHFTHLTDGTRIVSPYIWECTRFCLAPEAPKATAARLMLAAAELGLASGLSHAVGVFDGHMTLIYRRLGWGPIILGASGTGRGAVSVGLWAFAEAVLPRLRAQAGVTAATSRGWVTRAFGPNLAA